MIDFLDDQLKNIKKIAIKEDEIKAESI